MASDPVHEPLSEATITDQPRVSHPLGELPSGESTRLHQVARNLGNALGRAVVSIREMPARGDMSEGSPSTRAWEAGEDTDLERRFVLRERLARIAKHAGARVRLLADQDPLYVVAAVSCTAFVAGILLRIWRSEHA